MIRFLGLGQINPATNEKLWSVPIATSQDVDDAVESAQRAFETWSETPFKKRNELVNKFKEHYLSYADEMTDLMCKETGKPVIYELEQSGYCTFVVADLTTAPIR